MLVLTRRRREKLMIGDDVIITILEVNGTEVRIGIDAPRSVGVHRAEVYKRIQRELSTAGVKSPTAEGAAA